MMYASTKHNKGAFVLPMHFTNVRGPPWYVSTQPRKLGSFYLHIKQKFKTPEGRYFRPILPQPDYPNDPQRSLEFFQRLGNENNVLPLEDWKQCFNRRNASAPNEIVPGLYLSNIKTAAQCLLGYDMGYPE